MGKLRHEMHACEDRNMHRVSAKTTSRLLNRQHHGKTQSACVVNDPQASGEESWGAIPSLKSPVKVTMICVASLRSGWRNSRQRECVREAINGRFT
jgi:hypothetical protein